MKVWGMYLKGGVFELHFKCGALKRWLDPIKTVV
jgi:hypothetical protein